MTKCSGGCGKPKDTSGCKWTCGACALKQLLKGGFREVQPGVWQRDTFIR